MHVVHVLTLQNDVQLHMDMHCKLIRFTASRHRGFAEYHGRMISRQARDAIGSQ